ncbi:tRNA 2-thiouridine(34) synthase MnmA [Candidatus Parcubacteria bacterium]|nr:tRNA 2-thiouridine(34) synthase MnmA [Patescibacteria group bacterium]MBU4309289.1 tRNA 2-thiouridine(34) synthase MnmA [Patescibacteria group bacterium]MBU4431991.1 tRNA 2-thiouridine(34) synthase MnmA [Patescibacteria group bacterium]MBU4577650.1 tRNA 2-thiouridine(34) synthase MnmA [Patescibacteria group bacterium]MCG2697336.1 tRNA 2-thiouridine(34) synthase MnmA [Candidatus Parcubacteria bacterium]
MINNNKKLVAIAISGGVDSAVAAHLLLQKGYEVIGIFMRLNDNYKPAEDAARLVCEKLGIKFYPLNIAEKFQKEIIDYYIDAYQGGQTPNPCVRCNKMIKFGELFKRAMDLGADYLATGHYIKNVEFRMSDDEMTYKLLKGEDQNKDQSYFLYNLSQDLLKKIFFPLADYDKADVKKLAEKLDLPNLKTESQDVCFLPGEHNDFLKGKIKLESGEIRDLNDKKLGEHQGLPLYTIGQRRGIEIGGTGPYYVVKLDYVHNILYVVNNYNDTGLFRDELFVENVNWISGKEPVLPFACEVVIRYRHRSVECVIGKAEISDDGQKSYHVKFSQSQRAIAIGQSAVFYRGNELLGGGVITR